MGHNLQETSETALLVHPPRPLRPAFKSKPVSPSRVLMALSDRKHWSSPDGVCSRYFFSIGVNNNSLVGEIASEYKSSGFSSSSSSSSVYHQFSCTMLSYQFIILSLFFVSVSPIVSAKPLAVHRNSSSLKGAGFSTIDVNGFVHVFDSSAPFWRIQQTGQYGYMFSGSANDDITPTRHGDNSVMNGSIFNAGTNPFQIECQTWNSDIPVGKWTGLCVQVDKAISNSNLSTSTGPASWRDEMDLPVAGIQDSAAQTTDPTTMGVEPTPVPRAVIQDRAVDTTRVFQERAVHTGDVNGEVEPTRVFRGRAVGATRVFQGRAEQTGLNGEPIRRPIPNMAM
ncbi:hypothetical protein WG66_000090 [Moniliophthora roreri]|nr:hypothetical protein WG66_000090 [Moniliophthora roreri]